MFTNCGNGVSKKAKCFKSENYNYIFNPENGTFLRWGKTMRDDPDYSPFGPEILDIEVSTVCHKACAHCYKSNTAKGKYMTFETFKQLFAKFPKMLTQIAFGVGDIDGNPDLWKIMSYCRENGIIPNITINGERLTSEHIKNLCELCGAVAISAYDFFICFSAIKQLDNYRKNNPTTSTLRQINIHSLLSEQTYTRCMQLVEMDRKEEGIEALNSIVFLWVKPCGKHNNLREISQDRYKKLVEKALEKGVPIGFDSCSAPMFLKSIEGRPDFNSINNMVESCESTLFSYYINIDGIGFPCSFSEQKSGYNGIDILKVEDFVKDVWYNKETKKFRGGCISSKDCDGCKKCTVYELGKR